MPTPITNRTEAVARLCALVQASAVPVLSPAEVGDILDRHQRARLWVAATAYAVGERVRVVTSPPTFWGWRLADPGSGVYFRCVRAGTSGSGEPTWYGGGLALSGIGLEDGGASWLYDGQAYPDLWDLKAAAHDGWLMKAGKAAGKYDVSESDQKLSRSQVYDHCVKMANRFAPVYIV